MLQVLGKVLLPHSHLRHFCSHLHSCLMFPATVHYLLVVAQAIPLGIIETEAIQPQLSHSYVPSLSFQASCWDKYQNCLSITPTRPGLLSLQRSIKTTRMGRNHICGIWSRSFVCKGRNVGAKCTWSDHRDYLKVGLQVPVGCKGELQPLLQISPWAQRTCPSGKLFQPAQIPSVQAYGNMALTASLLLPPGTKHPKHRIHV